MRRRRALLTTAVAAAALCTGCSSAGTSAVSAEAAGSSSTAPPSPAASSGVPSAVPGAASASAAVLGGPAGNAVPVGFDARRDAPADVAAALRASAADHRQVLLVFGADWCPDCRVFDDLLHSDEVAPVLAAGYRVVTVDVGRYDHNLDLAARYVDLRTSGIPALAVLAPDGAVRTTTDDGSFAGARAMRASAVARYLERWSVG